MIEMGHGSFEHHVYEKYEGITLVYLLGEK